MLFPIQASIAMRQETRRTWWRFGLRTLLLLVLVSALPMAWLSWQLAEGKRHERIASELQALGCSVRFSHKEWVPITNRQIPAMEEQSTLPSLVEKLGLSTALRRVKGVTLRTRNPGELADAIKLLKDLGSVTSISFYKTGIEESMIADLVNDVPVEKLYCPSRS